MVQLLPLLVAVSLAGSPAAAAKPGAVPSMVAGAAVEVRFAASMEAARAEARRDAHPIVVALHTAWCGWCRRLEREAFHDPAIAARSRRDLVFVKLDAEDRGEGSAIASKYNVRSFPTVLVLAADGAEFGRIRGYRPPAGILAELDRIAARQVEMAALLERERKTPADPETLFAVASAFESAHDDEQAFPRYVALLKLGAEARRFRERVLWSMAQLQSRRGDRNHAIEALRTIVEEFPLTPRAEDSLFELGRIHHTLGDVDVAIQSFETLLERFPESRYAAGIRMQLAQYEARFRAK